MVPECEHAGSVVGALESSMHEVQRTASSGCFKGGSAVLDLRHAMQRQEDLEACCSTETRTFLSSSALTAQSRPAMLSSCSVIAAHTRQAVSSKHPMDGGRESVYVRGKTLTHSHPQTHKRSFYCRLSLKTKHTHTHTHKTHTHKTKHTKQKANKPT